MNTGTVRVIEYQILPQSPILLYESVHILTNNNDSYETQILLKVLYFFITDPTNIEQQRSTWASDSPQSPILLLSLS
jgi:hypothetical protein